MRFITSEQVRKLCDAQPPAVVIDVRIPEAFAVEHLAGALNSCVFLVSFVDDVRRLIPDLAASVVVYGTGFGSLESTEACRRLTEAGYTAVHNFAGGLVEWKADGLATLGDGTQAHPAPNGPIPVNLAETRIEWTGRNLLNKHSGTVALKSGTLNFIEGTLEGGDLVIDMTSIRCTDIAEESLNALLIGHLKSPDFFDVARHPEAHLTIKKASPIPSGHPGIPNLQLSCDLTLRGITHDLPAVAVAGRTPEGRLAAQAVLTFDRTEWGSAYGSGRFFHELGKHLVNDLVEIQLRLVAGG